VPVFPAILCFIAQIIFKNSAYFQLVALEIAVEMEFVLTENAHVLKIIQEQAVKVYAMIQHNLNGM